jgi:hypothetical protein
MQHCILSVWRTIHSVVAITDTLCSKLKDITLYNVFIMTFSIKIIFPKHH